MGRVGYIWCEGPPEEAARRRRAVTGAGCERTFVEDSSTSTSAQLDRALAALGGGDQLVISRLEELGRSIAAVAELTRRLAQRGADLVVLEQGIDTSTPTGAAFFAVVEALGQIERGRGCAPADGRPGTGGLHRRKGRPTVMTPAKRAAARRLLGEGTSTAGAVARQLGVSRSTLYRHCGSDLADAGAPG